MIESHVRAEGAVLRAGRGHVQRADVAIDCRPGIHGSKRAADRRGITAAGGDQQVPICQSKHEAVRRSVAIEICPKYNVA